MRVLNLSMVAPRLGSLSARVAEAGTGFIVWIECTTTAELNDGFVPASLAGAISIQRMAGRTVASGIVDADRIHQPDVEPLVEYLAREFLREDAVDHCNVVCTKVASKIWWSGEESSA